MIFARLLFSSPTARPAPRGTHLLMLLLAGVLGACGGDGSGARNGVLTVQQAYVQLPPPGAMMAAGYFTLNNASATDYLLVGVDVEGFGRVEVHETQLEDGMMRMRPRPELSLPSGEQVEFAPGGLHLMLMQPADDLQPGALAAGQLHLRRPDGSAREVPIQLELRSRTAPAAPAEHGS